MARLFIAALTAATMLLPGAFRQAAHAAEPEFTFSLNLAIPPTHQMDPGHQALGRRN